RRLGGFKFTRRLRHLQISTTFATRPIKNISVLIKHHGFDVAEDPERRPGEEIPERLEGALASGRRVFLSTAELRNLQKMHATAVDDIYNAYQTSNLGKDQRP
ncbi:hypothetical protein ACEWPL_017285, partial [Roseovarius sp. S1116L3]|uniref:hypothetical protein n=1 Tax=Roseovarius roseus TaxID=3342636 RepID=UPI003B67E38F